MDVRGVQEKTFTKLGSILKVPDSEILGGGRCPSLAGIEGSDYSGLILWQNQTELVKPLGVNQIWWVTKWVNYLLYTFEINYLVALVPKSKCPYWSSEL